MAKKSQALVNAEAEAEKQRKRADTHWLALSDLLNGGRWRKKIRGRMGLSAIVLEPTRANGGHVIVMDYTGSDQYTDAWITDEFLAHVRDRFRGVDGEHTAMRELAEKIRAAAEEGRTGRGFADKR